MRIELPELCVVALIGASGSGKSSFARKHFKATEILSSDFFRGLVSDDETNQSVSQAAFDSLYYIANKRLDSRKLTVIDATNVRKQDREHIIRLARAQNVFAVAIVFDTPAEICVERSQTRPDRNFGRQVVLGHIRELKQGVRNLQREGFRYVHILKGITEIDAAEIVRTRLWNNRQEDSGPFDIIGDVHGCFDELRALLEKLGYAVDAASGSACHPDGRRALFLGDLCDRGPENVAVLRLVMNMVKAGTALCVPGNHDAKLLRYLRGSKVTVSHGLDRTVSQLQQESPEFVAEVSAFLDSLVSHYILDQGRLVVAHAGLTAELQGRASGKVRGFCLYGETTDETDEFGLPLRLNWAEEYRGNALVVYGHTPIVEARYCNNTVCIDTGCVFGNKLTAYRYPERELVDVPARHQYYAPVKPLNPECEENTATANIPDIADALGKRWIETRFLSNILISEESAASALEIMSRFSADPRWLIYLPPTMSPCGTSKLPDYLEHPQEAFDYFKKHSVEQVICERKHMGSRAIITLCRNYEVARARFGVDDGSSGIIYTRTGRHFFYEDHGAGCATETALLERLRSTLDASGFWEAFHTDWVCLDTELMPWSAKARELLVEQYAPVGRAGRDGIASALEALRSASGAYAQRALQEQPAQPASASELPIAESPVAESSASEPPTTDPPVAESPVVKLPTTDSLVAESPAVKLPTSEPQNADLATLLNDYTQRAANLALYTEAYRRYCWQVSSINDYRIAPFHILATEGKVWHNETHLEHLSVIQRYMTGDPIFIATDHLVVDPSDERSVAAGIDWWQNLTTAGGEGMVVKPLNFIARKAAELLQPAVKCRGREYLRIIYGPEYTDAQRLNRLRGRSLGKKRRLALAEFALGLEALERFVGKEPLRRVHECVFGILALENEAVDPRL